MACRWAADTASRICSRPTRVRLTCARASKAVPWRAGLFTLLQGIGSLSRYPAAAGSSWCVVCLECDFCNPLRRWCVPAAWEIVCLTVRPLRPLSRSTTLSAIAKASRTLSWQKLRAWLVFRSSPSTSLRRTCWRCRALRASAPLLRLLPLPPKHGRRRRLGPGDAGVLASCLRRPATSASM